jgi:NAD-dependent dihydropyrimidine dehydrogenase PreA subunit
MAPIDVYRQLQERLDALPQRFPATSSGVEIRILRQLFTPEDAAVALALSAIPEPVSLVHRRRRRAGSREALAAALDRMAHQGLIARLGSKGRARYCLMPFVVGIFEHQQTRLTPELERDVRQYSEEAFGQAVHTKRTTQMRTVPVDANLLPDRDIGTYEDIRAYVRRSPGPFAAMDCICRLGRQMNGHDCHQTSRLQTCLTFGMAAKGMVQSGAAHFISREDMLELLEEADRDGLVLQPENTQDPLFVCCCCGCCCGILTSAKRLPEPATYFSANYYAEVDSDRCEACGTCLARCQMDAVSLDTGRAEIARSHCIGCGLCVNECQSGAIALRASERRRVPPTNTVALYLQQYRDRYGTLGLAAAVGKRLVGLKV